MLILARLSVSRHANYTPLDPIYSEMSVTQPVLIYIRSVSELARPDWKTG